MKIKNFILINSIWVICLLLVGCPTPNPELVKQRDLLIKANEELDQKLKEIDFKRTNSEEINIKYINIGQEKSRDIANAFNHYRQFWIEHAETMSRSDVLEHVKIPKEDILFYDGTPQIVLSYYKDEKFAFDKTLEPYATMPILPLQSIVDTDTSNDIKDVIIVDNALRPMPRDGYIKGFEIMLENVTEIRDIGLVILNESMKITDSQDFKIDLSQRGFFRIPVKGKENWSILRVFFDESFGNIPIRKGYRWALKVPSNARIPCAYIGVNHNIPKEFKDIFGGDVLCASYTPGKSQGFSSPSMYAEKCEQDYPKLGRSTVATDKKKEDNLQSLKPLITFGVYGVIKYSKSGDDL